jgi:hypothetical protein
MKRIDVHNHVCPVEIIDAVRRNPQRFGMQVQGEGDALKLVRPDTRHAFALPAELYDADAKLQGLDRRKLDAAFISPGPMYFFY